MKLVELKRNFLSYYLNNRGWKTNRKIITFESDDWGSIRMPSTSIYNLLSSQNTSINKHPYLQYDCLESNDDLDGLFNILTLFRDGNGNHPCITANTIVANPDFQKIKQHDYKQYFFEPFINTLGKYPKHDKVYTLYKKGIQEKLFYPQFHGREHLNFTRWMTQLHNPNSFQRQIFTHCIFDLSDKEEIISKNSFMDALNFSSSLELETQKQTLEEGLNLFESLFGYKSLSFIAPCYIWHPQIEKTLNKMGVKYIQSSIFQKIPTGRHINDFKKKTHFTGEVNMYEQLYMVRNCRFEPSILEENVTVDSTIRQIEKAFNNNKPAIICSHRLNFIGGINNENREKNLGLLNKLIKKILYRWPDVEFMNSAELGSIILN